MKISEIEIDRRLETTTDNAVQRLLRRTLAWLDNGKMWAQRTALDAQGRRCASSALSFHATSHTEELAAWENLNAAAIQLWAPPSRAVLGAYPSMVILNDRAKSFLEVRAVFERAIQLAATEVAP